MILGCCILAMMLGGVESATICASQSTASGLATTSVTSGTPASFTIQVQMADLLLRFSCAIFTH
jgi:hypothetical protein